MLHYFVCIYESEKETDRDRERFELDWKVLVLLFLLLCQLGKSVWEISVKSWKLVDL